jgi:hypothetical protein
MLSPMPRRVPPAIALTLAAIVATVVLAACGGGGGGDNSEDAVRRDVEAMFDSVFGDDVDVREFARYFPEECEPSIAELSLGLAFVSAFLEDTAIEFEVTDVELLGDDRALVTMTTSGIEFFGSPTEGGDSEELMVLQDGRWRSTSDCEDFDGERGELGLSTTTDDDGTDFSTDFSFGEDDFGPPRPAALGEPLAIGDLVVTVTGAHRSEEAVDDFGEAPEGIYVVVEFTLANDGSAPTGPWSALQFGLFDERDRTWDHEGLPFEDVGPGFSREYEVAWDVPVDATGFRVVIGPDPFAGLELAEGFAPYEVALAVD